ncbi:MAG TPA: PQQ-binding-like beta-propeller repeat protein, partial [Streptomyces sp.]|nr:PQQ-binding-like beta-propeller repeat protein [Streptomyces sp.]
LFENSLVCLDAKTGKRVWHFQLVHHGLWDWDVPAAPTLLDIMVDGRKIKAVAQVTKQGFVYTFDRVTGAPVWPIEERAVPSGNVPGEWYAPTQPYPTKPPAYEPQDVTAEELVDFTPELRQEALKIIGQYKYGSLFMPPSVAESRPGGTKGTIQRMGTVSTTWNGAGVDPETGILYVPSVQNPGIIEMVKAPDARNDWITNPLTLAYGPYLEGPRGLPTPFKPPYGRFTAIDMNKGTILWSVANGIGPRDHPAIKHLKLPPLGQGGRASPLVTKTMVFLGEGGNDGVAGLPPGGGGKMFRAYDKASGKVLWEMELPGGTTGEPMTYMVNGKQYVVVAVGWKDTPGQLIALALP